MLLYIMHVFIPIPLFTIYGYFRFTLPRFHKKYLLTAKKYRIYLRTWYHRDIFSVNKVFLLCIVLVCIFIFFFFYISVFMVFHFSRQHVCSAVSFRYVYSFVVSTGPKPLSMRQTSRGNGQLVNIFYFYKFTRFLCSFF